MTADDQQNGLDMTQDELDSGFRSVVDGLTRMTPRETDALRIQVECVELAYDAYTLGLEYLSLGVRHKARQWLEVAARYDVTDAQRVVREELPPREQGANEDAALADRPDTGLATSRAPSAAAQAAAQANPHADGRAASLASTGSGTAAHEESSKASVSRSAFESTRDHDLSLATPVGISLLEGAGPTAARIKLGSRLRHLRVERQMPQGTVSTGTGWSTAKLSRIERGMTSLREHDIVGLLDLYGVADPGEREAYLELVRQSHRTPWWHAFSDVLPNWFPRLLDLESAASRIRTYDTQVIPGLLQTPEYAEAVTRTALPLASAREVDRRVELRMKRQQLLTDLDAPKVWAVLDEATLHRVVGGRRVMKDQLERLTKISELPNVIVQVVPFEAKWNFAVGGALTILGFCDSDLPDIVHREQLSGAVYIDERREVEYYVAAMDRLATVAETPKNTLSYVDALIEGRAKTEVTSGVKNEGNSSLDTCAEETPLAEVLDWPGIRSDSPASTVISLHEWMARTS
ncbi:helix-turn-helix transcriptional regulator [Streptomyces sp. XD-27]|uniref:helix-turn-helix domain-containing protein n=1 Tax=Streptomyces sp. XD-27 TaxID=3062779 RepID=UPI0026F4505A|nr:helix-turn-helix transcriptional regulator [Streptomyces sp. XD-27]WKX72159.1 helix-turn-helix transcriptional regulator [Streptomyces sp. XD-27]